MVVTTITVLLSVTPLSQTNSREDTHHLARLLTIIPKVLIPVVAIPGVAERANLPLILPRSLREIQTDSSIKQK